MIQDQSTFTERDAPADVLREIREIDPKADLVWIGDAWMLGVWNGNAGSREKAQDQLRAMEGSDKAWTPTRDKRAQILKLCVRGFRPIHLYEPEWHFREIVEDFRVRDHNWRTKPESTFEERFQESLGFEEHQNRMATVRDFVQSEMPTLHRIIMRARKSFHFGRNTLSKKEA